MSYIEDIPKYGFGTAFSLGQGPNETPEEEFMDLSRHAISLGIRHFDCSPLYGTQKALGRVLKEARVDIPRSDFFITSKLPVHMMRTDKIDLSIKKTLAELQVSYLDLFLIHAPFATQFVNEHTPYPTDEQGQLLIDDSPQGFVLEQAWRKLAELKERGFVKYIGLSNVNESQLDRMIDIYPVDVVQNEYHLFNQDRIFFDHCEEIDVHYEAYSAFGNPPRSRKMNLPTYDTDPTVNQIASENNLTNAEVIIQWLHQQPLSYVIKTESIAQIEENVNATKLSNVSLNDMIDLDSLNQRARLYHYDEYRNIARHREYPFSRIAIKP